MVCTADCQTGAGPDLSPGRRPCALARPSLAAWAEAFGPFGASYLARKKRVAAKGLPNVPAQNPIPDRSLLPLLPSVQILFRSFCEGRHDYFGLPLEFPLGLCPNRWTLLAK
jgi:hypothetical protein